MINFSSYFQNALNESKFREIDQNLIQKVKNIVYEYNLIYKNLSKSDAKVFTEKVKKGSHWFEYFEDEGVDRVAEMSEIEFKDLADKTYKTAKILIAYGGNGSSLGNYDSENAVLTLYHNEIKKLTDLEIEAVIIHELTHGFQEYKATSDQYEKALKKMAKGLPHNKKVYFSEPVEIDAHFTELAIRIKEEYAKLVELSEQAEYKETSRVFQKRIEKFLLELKLFIKSDAKSYLTFEELPLPRFFSTHQDFLENISKTPNLWKKLKEKLSVLYLELTNPPS